jgi:hypothetical protein
MSIFTKAFWSYAGERAGKTIAQTAIALLTVGGITGVLDVAWVPLASAVALAGIISILTSMIAYAPDAVVTYPPVLVGSNPTPEQQTTPAAPLVGE